MLRREAYGQAIVETALVVPLLLFACVGGADLARAFAMQLAVQNGARAGAESYALVKKPSVAATQQHAIYEIILTPGINGTAANGVGSTAQSHVLTARDSY